MRNIYMDHAATTPVRREVIEAMTDALRESFGNPSSVHQFGRTVRKRVEEARRNTAEAIQAKPKEIYFTSGGTEADNLAILGAARAHAEKGKHIVTSAVEHHAVLDACHFLEKQGFEVTVLPVDQFGQVSAQQLESALRDDTILVSIMHANNEIGTINPIEEIGHICRERGVLFHTDAVQSLGKIKVDVNRLNVDLLTVTGHKIYGPKGTGALFIREGIKIDPLVHGGGQEKSIRPGTENVAGIVGFGTAIRLAASEQEEEAERLSGLRDRLVDEVIHSIPDTRLNGHPTMRLPHIANFSFPGTDGEMLVQGLDFKGVAVSTGSACTSGSVDPSHVLVAIGLERGTALASVRFSLGVLTTQEDVEYAAAALRETVQMLRS
ncbi:cysteine desulfurase family protein [Effusibacillus dendaii]|uniref:cysteine desulfurase n=1 Tax=Effusibacillus dendaii TaxID=2743772 RepID=A0A7I8DHP9_9BACL|nr:cysteine desulfurase family protein [Effusibacillus dendaii]BCJ88446.1 cysteine desulfurase IscS [Effusibacillus dendaii]